MKRKWQPYTIVAANTLDPVVPIDCNPGHEGDEGMLVYRSEAAAKCAARHQKDLHQVKCRAVPLSAVIEHEANVAGSVGNKPSKAKVNKQRGRQRIHEAIGAKID